MNQKYGFPRKNVAITNHYAKLNTIRTRQFPNALFPRVFKINSVKFHDYFREIAGYYDYVFGSGGVHEQKYFPISDYFFKIF